MSKKDEAHTTFVSFLKAKEQRLDWIILITSCIIGYIVLKICYPYPATISDSGTYVNAAVSDMFTFYRPFGYSYFLQIVHAFSSSVHAVFIVQILLYFLSAALFAFVVKYIFPPANKIVWWILLFSFVFSPIAFYMSNAIMSDLLFAVMIYFMLASFLYFFKKNNWVAFCLLLVSLFFALQIRYSAMIFPVLFTVCFIMMKGRYRWAGIIGVLAVTFIFYNQVKQDMYKTTGFKQFSTGFDGWQLANNTVHIVPFVDIPPEKIANPELRLLHQFVLAQKDVIYKKTQGGTSPSASFMWINDEPLKQYLFAYIQYTQQSYPLSWIRLGSTTYKDYGKYLITHYPVEFMQYYYLPNSKSIIYPTSKEIIGTYTPINIKDISEWYKISEGTDLNAKHPVYESFVAEASALSYIPIWILIAVAAVISIVMRKRLSWHDGYQHKIFWIIVAAGILYYSSTVFASPVSLRFWIPMNAVLFAVTYILLNRIVEYKKKMKEDIN